MRTSIESRRGSLTLESQNSPNELTIAGQEASATKCRAFSSAGRRRSSDIRSSWTTNRPGQSERRRA